MGHDQAIPDEPARPAPPNGQRVSPPRVLIQHRQPERTIGLVLSAFVLGMAIMGAVTRFWGPVAQGPAPAPGLAAAPNPAAHTPVAVPRPPAVSGAEAAEDARRELELRRAEHAELERLRERIHLAEAEDRRRQQAELADRQARQQEEDRRVQALLDIQRLQFEREARQRTIEMQAEIAARQRALSIYQYQYYGVPRGYTFHESHLGGYRQALVPIIGE